MFVPQLWRSAWLVRMGYKSYVMGVGIPHFQHQTKPSPNHQDNHFPLHDSEIRQKSGTADQEFWDRIYAESGNTDWGAQRGCASHGWPEPDLAGPLSLHSTVQRSLIKVAVKNVWMCETIWPGMDVQSSPGWKEVLFLGQMPSLLITSSVQKRHLQDPHLKAFVSSIVDQFKVYVKVRSVRFLHWASPAGRTSPLSVLQPDDMLTQLLPNSCNWGHSQFDSVVCSCAICLEFLVVVKNVYTYYVGYFSLLCSHHSPNSYLAHIQLVFPLKGNNSFCFSWLNKTIFVIDEWFNWVCVIYNNTNSPSVSLG